ncbi:hypothetical protein BH20ACT5_BH20ACT5_22790 [soil metagenome]
MTAPPTAPVRPVVYLHVGAPKSGTTYLQRIMWHNRERLRAAGVLYPGDSFGAHVQAAFDLRGAGFEGYHDPLVAGKWSGFVDAAREWNGPVVISQELFSPAEPVHIDAAMQALDFSEVHVVYTARELSRQIPAAWQEDVKNRFAIRFDDFVTQVRAPGRAGHDLGRMFWQMQDPVTVLARWSRALTTTRVHVVTVPPRGQPPAELWRRFASVVGIEPGSVDLSGAFQNSSLGAAETTFLRRLNVALDDRVAWPLYNELVKHYLAQEVLVNRAGAIPIRLPAQDRVWAAQRSAQMVTGLDEAGYDVVGSLDDLLPTAPGNGGPPDADKPPLEAQLDFAVAAFAALLLRVATPRQHAEPAPQPMLLVRHALQLWSEQHRPVMWARRGYQRAKLVLRGSGRG